MKAMAVDIAAPPGPQRLGRYQVLRHLASGGMAQVSLARDPAGRHVVLKRIRGDQASDEKLVRMFLEEARVSALLRHPNIIEVFESGADAGEYFFAMDYVHGEDLRRVLKEVHERRDQVPLAQVLTLIANAAAGLHHAHEARGPDGRPLGLVHRDVSPANILVGFDGSVKVTDFGIAKATLHTIETKSGTLKGKVSYMSPEQVTGRELDRRSDVFSLGIVFYECATARRLFKNDNDFLTMSSIVQGAIPPPSTHRPDLPAPVERIIMRALALDPKHRFDTCDELRDEIETFMRSIGSKTSPSGVADYMKSLFGVRREPWLETGDEATLVTAVSIDFDGSASGVVPPPEAAAQRLVLPRKLAPDPASLIARAHQDVLNDPSIQPIMPATPAPRPANVRSAGSGMRWAVRGGVAAVTIGVLLVVAMRLGGKRSDHEAPATTKVEMPVAAPAAEPPAAEAPPATPAPAPAPEPAPAKPALAAKPAPAPPPKPVVHREHKTPAKKKDAAWDPNAFSAPQ